MKKLFTLIALAAMAFAAQADVWTAADGSAQGEYAPVYGYNFETEQHNQMQYPTAELNGVAAGTQITGVKFYTGTSNEVNGLGGSVKVSMANIDEATPWAVDGYGYISGDLLGVNVTTVATVAPAADENGVWTITFEAPFTYAGGALLIDVQTVNAGEWQDTYFFGKEMGANYVMSVYGYAGSKKGQTVLPKATFTYEGGGAPVGHTYTVAGTENLFGSNWAPEDVANDMVKGEDGIYTWTKKDVEMNMGDVIEFKVVEDHSWTNNWPGENYKYTFPYDDTYDIVITFNPEDEEVNFTATGHNPVVPEMVYTVVGPQEIFGTNWDVTDEANNMEKDEDGIYIWSKDNVALYGNFGFKVVGNHSYDIYQWPTESNWIANLTQGEGIYNIMITFDPEAEESARITCTLTKIGDITVEHTYTVAGSDNLFGSFWNAADTTNDMVKGEDGIYTWTKNDVVFDDAATIEFKIVQDHAWTYAWPTNNWVINDVTEAGTYSFVITFNPAVDDAEKIHVTVTKATQGLRGDVNSDNNVDITDATLLINYLLYGEAPGFNEQNANCDLQGGIDISDATALINYLLNSAWGN